MEQHSKAVARISRVETSAERTAGTGEGLAVPAPAAATALSLLADSVRRGAAAPDGLVQALQAAGVHEAVTAADRVMQSADDPYDFDVHLHADNLAGAAGDVRRAFEWLCLRISRRVNSEYSPWPRHRSIAGRSR
ncbi:hypothetical protein [Streptomyces sp. NPDC045369]|uniref:hypothetical protein n=1 Tax=Streptomyces sp. NPDC045369 TaxID=3155732 RepID=UPI003410BB36